jgi:hypothetical protein
MSSYPKFNDIIGNGAGPSVYRTNMPTNDDDSSSSNSSDLSGLTQDVINDDALIDYPTYHFNALTASRANRGNYNPDEFNESLEHFNNLVTRNPYNSHPLRASVHERIHNTRTNGQSMHSSYMDFIHNVLHNQPPT